MLFKWDFRFRVLCKLILKLLQTRPFLEFGTRIQEWVGTEGKLDCPSIQQMTWNLKQIERHKPLNLLITNEQLIGESILPCNRFNWNQNKAPYRSTQIQVLRLPTVLVILPSTSRLNCNRNKIPHKLTQYKTEGFLRSWFSSDCHYANPRDCIRYFFLALQSQQHIVWSSGGTDDKQVMVSSLETRSPEKSTNMEWVLRKWFHELWHK